MQSFCLHPEDCDIAFQNTAFTTAVLWKLQRILFLRIQVLWGVTLCHCVGGAFIFKEGTVKHSSSWTAYPWRWRHHNASKCQEDCPSDSASHPRRLQSSGALLWEPQILQLLFFFTATQIPDLIGDFSKPFILPLMEGRHQDLKTISADTLASLLNGDFSEEVESYVIVDCR